MKPVPPWAALYSAAALAMVSAGAGAEEMAAPEDRYQPVLDIDRDGRRRGAYLGY